MVNVRKKKNEKNRIKKKKNMWMKKWMQKNKKRLVGKMPGIKRNNN